MYSPRELKCDDDWDAISTISGRPISTTSPTSERHNFPYIDAPIRPNQSDPLLVSPVLANNNNDPTTPDMTRHRWGAVPGGGGPAAGHVFNRPINAVSANAAAQREPELTLMEKQYLLACERGDLASVRHYLLVAQNNKSFNINCVDPLGRNALLIAIENENIEMIETLLEANVETGDAILYAINEENVEAVEIILNHLEKTDKFTAEVCSAYILLYSVF